MRSRNVRIFAETYFRLGYTPCKVGRSKCVTCLLSAAGEMPKRSAAATKLGCTVLQICAICFHVSRGEAAMTPLNLVLLALAAFVLWGRARKAPIRPRV